MKKSISIIVLITLLLNFNLPILSYALDEQENVVEEKNTVEEITEEVKEEVKEENKEENNGESKEGSDEVKEEITEQEDVNSSEENKDLEKKENELNEDLQQEEMENKEVKANLLKTPNEDPDTIVELDEKIKNELSYYDYDTNGDGEYSILELSNENLQYLSINCDSQTINLNGIEYMLNITGINFYNSTSDTDFSKLSELSKLESLGIYGNINNLSFLEELNNLTELSLYFYNDYDNFTTIGNLEKLERLSLDFNSTIDLSDFSNLSNLKYLAISTWTEGNTINYDALEANENLDTLEVRYYATENLSGIDKIKNLKTLHIIQTNSVNLDTDNILRLENLENLNLTDYTNDLEWINNLVSLKHLGLFSYSDNSGTIINQEFIDLLNSFEIEEIDLSGTLNVDLGELETEKETAFDYDSIPIIKAVTDSNNKLYREGYDIQYSTEDENVNGIRIDESNRKIYIIPKEETRRYDNIRIDGGLTIKLKWETASDNEIIKISDKIKEFLIDNEYDINGDGEFSKKELDECEIYSISLYFSYNEKVDLTGIEYFKNLHDLYLNLSGDGDLSKLKEIESLERVNIHGSISNTEFLKDLSNITYLGLYTNAFSVNNLSFLNDFNNLEELEVTNPDNNSFESIKNLPKLKILTIYCNDEETIIDYAKVGQLQNIEELELYYVDTSDLSGLENMTNLKSLKIQPNYDHKDDLDVTTLKKLTGLRELDIYVSNDISWLKEFTNLETLILTGTYTDYGYEITEDFVNELKQIPASIRLQGEFYYNLGAYEVNTQMEKDLKEIPLIRELVNSESSLYASDLRVDYHDYGEDEAEYNDNTMIISAPINDQYDHVVDFYVQTKEGYQGFNLRLKWRGFIKGTTTEDIPITDNNLKQALLDKYDIDGDKRITNHDVINMISLDLENCNIVDVSGLEYAVNLECLYLSGNKISNVEPIKNILKKDGCIVYLDNNYIRSLEGIEDINFSNIDLSNNYLDFSDNSDNLQLVENYARAYAENKYDNNPNMSSYISREKYIEGQISRIVGCQKIQKYGTFEERDDVLEFEEPLFNKLKSLGFDMNSDGNITKGELSDFYYHKNYWDTLNLSGLGITNIENLKYLANVSVIDLSKNNISDITPLKYCKQLYEIYLNNNNIENIDELGNYFKASNINLADNKIKDISALKNLRTAKTVWNGDEDGLEIGEYAPYRTLYINLSNNEIEDISVINDLETISEIILSGNNISDISILSNYDFNKIHEGFNVTDDWGNSILVDVTNNYINIDDTKNIEAIEYFESNGSTIETGNQYLKLVDDDTNTQIETYGEVTAKIVVEIIDENDEKYQEIIQSSENSEILYAADISIVDGEYNGKIIVTIPLDESKNGKTVKVIHEKENGEKEEFIRTVENGSVSVEVDELSPFYVLFNENDQTQVTLGDVNGDKKINSKDAKMVLQAYTGKITLTDEQKNAADVNKDGKVNSKDAKLILQYYTGKITEF